MEKVTFSSRIKLEVVIAILIAIVSITVAAAAWRINSVSSSASDASRQGLLDDIKKQAFANENWRETYAEAGFAENYAATLAEVEAMEASGNQANIDQAANLRQYLLPSLQLLASPLVSDAIYQNADGTYDLQKRFDSLEAGIPEIRDLNPQASFQLADRYFSEQRWLTVITVILAISLFWLALAEISGRKLRVLTLIIGAGIYGMGVVGFILIEVIFVILRGGAL